MNQILQNEAIELFKSGQSHDQVVDNLSRKYLTVPYQTIDQFVIEIGKVYSNGNGHATAAEVATSETPAASAPAVVNRHAKLDSDKELRRLGEEWLKENDPVASELVNFLQDNSTASVEQIEKVATSLVDAAPEVAPDARTTPVETPTRRKIEPPYPPELELAVKSGVARYKHDHWFVSHCKKCGNYRVGECCGEPTYDVSAVRSDNQLTLAGLQAIGKAPITPAAPSAPTAKTILETCSQQDWWHAFSGFDELEDGGLKMYIEDFIPEGITIISSLPKEGKTWLALSIAKALTSGKPLFGKPGFEVPEPVPVLYLAAEVCDRAFKQRVRKFQITNDKTKFLCRTLSKGSIGLSHPDLENAVRSLKPIVILDVLSCFSSSDDEDDSVENQKLRSMIANLRRAGARAIVILHHSTKDFKKDPTKERAVRGSGDILAMVDVVWALMLDDRLYKNSGIEQVEVIGWGRDFSPMPLRLALTRKATTKDFITFKTGVVSIIDTTGDLEWVDKVAAKEAAETADRATVDQLEALIQRNPAITLSELAERTNNKRSYISGVLKEAGWSKPSGRPKKNQLNQWKKTKE